MGRASRRGGGAGWVGLSGWVEHVTLPAGLSAGGSWGWGRPGEPEAEIDICLWQENELVSPSTHWSRGLREHLNFISHEAESRR